MLIQTRAQGGNLLLNVGPTPEGEIPQEQAAILNEVALWMFINEEAMQNIESWYVTREGDIWFTKKQDENTVFIYLTGIDWIYGERKEFLLRSVKSTTETEISVLGHNGRVLEYRPDVDPAPYISESDDGLRISVVRAQRIYNDRKWPNPVVVKLENVTLRED
jgi:alpha-L-fucosidase